VAIIAVAHTAVDAVAWTTLDPRDIAVTRAVLAEEQHVKRILAQHLPHGFIDLMIVITWFVGKVHKIIKPQTMTN
jgi:hypothetical protein